MHIVNPVIPSIFESWKPFDDFFYTDHRGWIMPDIDKIKSLANDYDFVIANCSTEHWGSQRDFPLVASLHDILTEHFAKNFVCLCHDPADAALRDRILYFPFWAWRGHGHVCAEDLITRSSRHYVFSNLNWVARDFRIASYLALRSKPYADKCCVTLHNCIQQTHDYDGHFRLTQAELATWHEIHSTLPLMPEDDHSVTFGFMHPAFQDSYVHLVSESTVKDKIFLTEKTWQTIAAGQIFMIWGNAGIVAHLRDLGVDVFDDIVDHAYDSQTDHRARFDLIQLELDRLACLDWPGIYQHTAQRRILNAHDFYNQNFVKMHTDKLRQRLPAGCF